MAKNSGSFTKQKKEEKYQTLAFLFKLIMLEKAGVEYERQAIWAIFNK